jgi:F0F1-type ATP synthase membrane subunit b/b'
MITNTPAAFLAPLLLAIFQHAESGVPAWIPKTVNLVIFFSILYFLLRKPTREFFTTRYNEIRAGLDRAARERAEAETRMKELDARMARLDAEIADIKAQARREAEAEAARITAAAQANVEKFRATAQREIESAKQNAMVELRQFAADQAVALAEQIIRRELKPEDDAKLVQRASAAIGSAK